jgi:transcriptional regulator with XRE-family HTH domain
MTGKRFKQIRLELGMTQAQLAKLLGVWENTVAHWDRGDKPIPGPVELCMKLLLEKKEKETKK